MNKTIDLIIPAYKSQQTILKTLASIASQSMSDQILVTIVNDADGIGYKDVIQRFNGLLDINEITLEKNAGPGVARQAGIDNTSNEFILFADADDTYYGSFAVQMLYEELEQRPKSVGAFGQHYLQVQDPKLKFVSYNTNYVWMFAKLYRRAVIEKYNVYFNETRANEDVGFNRYLRLVTCVDPDERPVMVDFPVYMWHDNPNSITRSNKDFTHSDNITGYIENCIYAIKHANRKEFNNKHYVTEDIIRTMSDLYVFWEESAHHRPEFAETNFKACVNFYHELFEIVELTQDSTFVDKTILKALAEKSETLAGFFPQMTYHQFMDKIRNYELDNGE